MINKFGKLSGGASPDTTRAAAANSTVRSPENDRISRQAELDALRNRGITQTNRKALSVSAAEQTQFFKQLDVFLKDQKNANAADRRRREEAAALLQGYRIKYTADGKKELEKIEDSSNDDSSPKAQAYSTPSSTSNQFQQTTNSKPIFPTGYTPNYKKKEKKGEKVREENHQDDNNISSGLSDDEKIKEKDDQEKLQQKLAAAKIKDKSNKVKKDEGPMVETVTCWRSFISRGSTKFPPEKGRYHLYCSYACPWAHRALIILAIKGLEDVIGVTIVHPVWRWTRPDIPNDSHVGWVFGNPDGEPFKNTAGLGGPFEPSYEDNEPDQINACYSIRELYELAGDTDGKYIVPVLWDKKNQTIVSNESGEIIRMLNSEFKDFCKQPSVDVYPKKYRSKIDEVNRWVYPALNNGVYRCGLASSQASYDSSIDILTEAFDRANFILQKQRYIAGDFFSEADIRLFVTLIRFDEVYAVYFKTNTRAVANHPAILNYCREIYQMPGIAETCNFNQIKLHYYCSHPSLNKLSIIPRGPNFEALLKEEHDRDILFPVAG